MQVWAFVAVVVIAGLALIWPIYSAVPPLRPYVLGLPFSFAWVVAWLLVVFGALVALYRVDEHDSASDENDRS